MAMSALQSEPTTNQRFAPSLASHPRSPQLPATFIRFTSTEPTVLAP